MNEYEVTERIEENTFECMDYMEDKLRAVIEKLIKQNEENLRLSTTTRDKWYSYGYNDALVDVLNELDIENDEGYYN